MSKNAGTLKPMIVAEASVNYVRTSETDWKMPEFLISQRFEQLIDVNRERGYVLDTWQLHRVINEVSINETIVAVFRLGRT